MMKAREVRERLKGKIDPDVSRVIEALCEDNSQLRSQIYELAELVNQFTDHVQVAIDSAHKTQDAVKAIKSKEAQSDVISEHITDIHSADKSGNNTNSNG